MSGLFCLTQPQRRTHRNWSKTPDTENAGSLGHLLHFAQATAYIRDANDGRRVRHLQFVEDDGAQRHQNDDDLSVGKRRASAVANNQASSQWSVVREGEECAPKPLIWSQGGWYAVDMTSALQHVRYQLENPQAAFFALSILSLVNPVLALVVCAVAMCVIYDRYLDGRYTALQLRILVVFFGIYSVSGVFFVLEALTR